MLSGRAFVSLYNMYHILFVFLLAGLSHSIAAQGSTKAAAPKIQVGAERTTEYLPMLKGKKIALIVNQTSRVGKVHLVDTLSALHIQIQRIFAPEHGFRGDADAGAHVKNTTDPKTGVEIVSLYGKKQKPSAEDLQGVDMVVFDIQDVGCRFYTFLSTLHYVMEACSENKVPLLILDCPNPNGYYVDGPVLDMKYRSFVGIAPLPVVHGLTLGEYAKLAQGEKWIDSAAQLQLTVITCSGYDHRVKYKLPVNPSPNLKNARAIFLYPSLCFFEGTNVSVGRGTEYPFQVIGSPYADIDSAYTFTPLAKPGATDPPFKGLVCKGYDLRRYRKELHTEMVGLNLSYLLKMYASFTDKSVFFLKTDFFDKLAGTDALRKQIIDGKTDKEIRDSWQPALNNYKELRKKYLLYKDF